MEALIRFIIVYNRTAKPSNLIPPKWIEYSITQWEAQKSKPKSVEESNIRQIEEHKAKVKEFPDPEFMELVCKAKGKQTDVVINNKNTQDAPESKEKEPDFIFRYNPEVCTLRYKGGEIVDIKNPSKGFYYIAMLVGSPRELFKAIELKATFESPEIAEKYKIYSRMSREKLKQEGLGRTDGLISEETDHGLKYHELMEQDKKLLIEIADAEKEGNDGLIEVLKERRLVIADQLSPADQRKKKEVDIQMERARNSVGHSISRAMKNIAQKDHGLWFHLHTSIAPYANDLTYSPTDVEEPPTWHIY